MTNNADAQIAREWASKALDSVFLNEVPIEGYRAAARHILATTTPPTMADIAWDDAVHAGLCAEHTTCGIVRMVSPDWDDSECIICIDSEGVAVALNEGNLTPVPGTRLDLTPRRPEDVPDDSPLIPEDDWRYASDATVALWRRLVPEFTPEHPTVLATHTLTADTLEYGVADAAGDIVWFPVDATVGTAEDARQDAITYANSDQFFRLVARRVSAPWEVTDE